MGTVKRLVILGAGPAARYVSYILSYDSTVEVIGHTDRNRSLTGTAVRGKPVLGTDEVLSDWYAKGVRHAIVGVGTPEVRSSLRKLALEMGFELLNAIHPSVVVSTDAKLGHGVVMEAGVVASDNPMFHDNSWIGLAAKVSHDVLVKNDCLVGGGAAVGAGVVVGERVLVGWGSVIGPGVKIGDDAIVGSGANVVHDVHPGAVVVGNPARVMKYRD